MPLILLSACSTLAPSPPPRWKLPEGKIAFQPICGKFRAPLLENVPPEGLVPAYLFAVNGASADEINRMAQALHQNGFAVATDGYPSINGVWIFFAVGEGVLKTQAMADRLFNLMCTLQFDHVQLVHVRYNSAAEKTRMI
jgi:hypothetical protein